LSPQEGAHLAVGAALQLLKRALDVALHPARLHPHHHRPPAVHPPHLVDAQATQVMRLDMPL
jgi:hypothetical protein